MSAARPRSLSPFIGTSLAVVRVATSVESPEDAVATSMYGSPEATVTTPVTRAASLGGAGIVGAG